jgi:hypothetical protein
VIDPSVIGRRFNSSRMRVALTAPRTPVITQRRMPTDSICIHPSGTPRDSRDTRTLPRQRCSAWVCLFAGARAIDPSLREAYVGDSIASLETESGRPRIDGLRELRRCWMYAIAARCPIHAAECYDRLRQSAIGSATHCLRVEPTIALHNALSALGVRRGKAALSSGCESHPANRSSRKQPEQLWRKRNG